MKNRVAKLVEIRKIELVKSSMPALNEKDDILVAVKAVGICGSDMHYFLEGGLGSFKQALPMDLGHEPAGVVVRAPKDSEFKKGDRVAIEPGSPCLECEWCLKGKHNLCEKGIFMVTNSQGAFADYVVVKKHQLVKIPKSMSYEVAALMEPLGVALHAVNLVDPKPTEAVTVVGSGPIGLSILLILKKFGFKKIYMVDKLPYRVKFAKKLGATEAFDLNNAVDGIKSITNKKGTRYVFDAGGTNESINVCLKVIGVSGTLGFVGIPVEDEISINPHLSRIKEITIKNVRRSNQTLQDCINLFTDDKEVEKLITHKLELNDIQQGFDMVGQYKNNVIKCMIVNK